MGRTAVLDDGFNLCQGVKTQRGRRYLWLDHVKLASRLRQRDQIVDVRHFTAPVLDDVAAAVVSRPIWKHVRCRACSAHWISYEGKERDVNIAVGLMWRSRRCRRSTPCSSSARTVTGAKPLASKPEQHECLEIEGDSEHDHPGK